MEPVVFVVGVDDSLIGESKRDVVDIVSTRKSGVGRGRHIDASATQAYGDGGWNVFIKMESDLARHPDLPASRGVWMDTS
jgi:hypothetical protein